MKTKVKQIELYSFDVFDTLITRRVGVPKGIFALMQEKIKGKMNLPKDFYTIRIESERLAREIGDCREITFDDIYSKMQADYDLNDETINYLKDLEIKTELENLVGIEENILKVQELLKQNERVILISDMYHSSNTIRMFLSHISPIFEKIKIYVSSEYKTSKYEGKLFRIVQQEENIKPQKWVHIGDNKNSDIKKAKNLKIKTEYFEFPPLMRYEEELLGLHPGNADYQRIVGASRITRLNKSENKEKYDFGASFTAPIVYNYVNWILEESLKKGFKTLHFIARDGYIPKIVADLIIEKRGLDIKTKYIYGSRLAWRVPSEENYKSFIELTLNDYCHKLSLYFLAYRLHVDIKYLNQFFNIKNVNQIFTDAERIYIKNQMLNTPEIKQYVLESNTEYRDLLLEYIKQEIDISNNIAFVDINGSGKTQDILANYINTIYPSKTHCFYLTTSIRDDLEKSSIKYTYLSEPRPHYHYFELLFRSLEGQTIGYKKHKNCVIAKQEKIEDTILLKWGFENYIKGIKDFTKNIFNKETINNKELCYIYQEFMTTKCDSQMASILGDIPFLTIGSEKNIQKVTPKLSWREFLLLLIKGNQINELSEFPHITLIRGNALSNFVKQSLLRLQQLPKCFIELKLYFKLKSLKNQKIMFWGASLWLENFIKKYRIKDKNILGIIDQNPNRIGHSVYGYMISSPKELSTKKPDYVVATVKNRARIIYFEINTYLQENYPNIKLYPNIFE